MFQGYKLKRKRKMTEEGIIEFLAEFGITRGKLDIARGWVNAPCPLAPYKHGSGEDERPSFGIAINDNGPSSYYCFGCTQDGLPLSWLLHTMWVASGAYPYEAAKVFLRREFHQVDMVHSSPKQDVWEETAEPETVEPLSKEVLAQYKILHDASGFEARRCREYMINERGLSLDVITQCGIRYSDERSTVIFPLTDVYGNVYVLRERSRKKKEMWTVSPRLAGFPDMEFPRLKNVGAWFGMFAVDWSRPVMLVEGEMDAMRLKGLGYHNVIASATAGVSKAQMNALCGISYILGYDADKGGADAHSRIRGFLGRKATLMSVDWGLAGCKDAGDLQNKEDLKDVLDAIEIVR